MGERDLERGGSGEAGARVPLSQCRKLFVQRDYSGGLGVKFEIEFPRELHGKIDEASWLKTMNELNELYADAERVGGHAVMETLLGCCSCYFSNLCVTTQYEKQLQKIAHTLEEQNRDVYIPRGLFITDPIERGLRVVRSALPCRHAALSLQLEVSFLTELAQPRTAMPGTTVPS